MSASNLFKYCQPAHGLVLFRRHDPLAFTAPELRGALAAAAEWLRLVRTDKSDGFMVQGSCACAADRAGRRRRVAAPGAHI